MKYNFERVTRADMAVESVLVQEAAKKLLARETNDIEVSEFAGNNPYNDIEVQENKGYVLRSREAFGEPNENKIVASAFEAFIKKWGNETKLFGENAKVVRASEYDDYKNGTDLLVEFLGPDGKTHVLALDVTSNSFKKDIEDKLTKKREFFEKTSETPAVKYFKSSFTEEKGRKVVVPAVAGMSAPAVKELLTKLEAIEKAKNTGNSSSKMEAELSSDPLREAVLVEIKEQLDLYATRSLSKQILPEAKAELAFLQEKISSLLSPEKIARTLSKNQTDPVFKEIVLQSRMNAAPTKRYA